MPAASFCSSAKMKLPSASPTAACAPCGAVGQPQLLEPDFSRPAPPLLSPERVEAYEGDPDNWRELNKPRHRVYELGEGRWKVQHYLGPKKWYTWRPYAWASRSYSAYALLDERARRRTRYRFTEMEKFEQGTARVELPNERVGLLTRQGRWLLRPRYQYVTKLRRGLAVARRQVRNQWRTGIIDSTGHWRWRPHAGWLSNLDAAGLVRAGLPDPARGPISFRRPDGSVPFANHTFHRAGPFWQGRAWVEVAPGQQGLIDAQGRWVTPARYELLTVAERMGWTDLRRPTLQLDFIEYIDGRLIRGLDIHSREPYFEPRQPETPYLLARRAGRYGFVDQRSGAEVVPCRYDSVLTVPEREHLQYQVQPYACAWRQGRPYVLNMRGQELIEGRYEGRMVAYADGPRLLLHRPADSTWAAIDTTGRLRTVWLPGAWSSGWLLPNNLAVVGRRGTKQLIDTQTGRVRLTAPPH
jgi:hypothetical protein